MSDIYCKPIQTADENPTIYPDWVIYNTGEFKTPLAILTDFEMKEILYKYANFHRIQLTKVD